MLKINSNTCMGIFEKFEDIPRYVFDKFLRELKANNRATLGYGDYKLMQELKNLFGSCAVVKNLKDDVKKVKESSDRLSSEYVVVDAFNYFMTLQNACQVYILVDRENNPDKFLDELLNFERVVNKRCTKFEFR